MEIWKDIDGYTGIYQVSNLGRVKSLIRTGRKKELILNQFYNRKYLRVYLMAEKGKTKSYLTHRLVAQAFLHQDDSNYEVNHKDGNCTNNTVDNLEWVSKSDNIKHAVHQLKTINPPYKKKRVIQYDKNMEFIEEWESIASASKSLNIDPSSISKCCKGKLKTTGGFVWKYLK